MKLHVFICPFVSNIAHIFMQNVSSLFLAIPSQHYRIFKYNFSQHHLSKHAFDFKAN